MRFEPDRKGIRRGVWQDIHWGMPLEIFLLVQGFYVISHLFERKSLISHVCFEQTLACLQLRPSAARNPQHIFCV